MLDVVLLVYCVVVACVLLCCLLAGAGMLLFYDLWLRGLVDVVCAVGFGAVLYVGAVVTVALIGVCVALRFLVVLLCIGLRLCLFNGVVHCCCGLLVNSVVASDSLLYWCCCLVTLCFVGVRWFVY